MVHSMRHQPLRSTADPGRVSRRHGGVQGPAMSFPDFSGRQRFGEWRMTAIIVIQLHSQMWRKLTFVGLRCDNFDGIGDCPSTPHIANIL